MSSAHESAAFRRFAEGVIRFRWLVLAFVLAVTGVLGWLMVTRLTVDNSTEYFAAGSPEDHAVLEQFQEDFGRDDLFFVLVSGDVFTMDFLERLRALHDDLESFDMDLGEEPESVEVEGFDEWGDEAGWGEEEGGVLIDQVTSLVNFRQTIYDDGAVRVIGFLDEPYGPEDLPDLRARALADRGMVGNIIGKDAKHTVLAVRTQPLSEADSDKVAVALNELLATHQAEGFDVVLTGSPAMNQALNAMVVEDMNTLVGLAVLVMSIVLFVLFRSVVGVVPPLMVVTFASVWTLGAMAWAGTPLTLLTNVLPAFLVCVGLGDAVHLVTVWRDYRRRGIDNREAVIRSVASTGIPITFTSLTTAAGLGSFVLASTRATQEVGVAGAFGVMAAWAISLLFLPVALSFWNRGVADEKRARPRDRLDDVIQAMTRASATPRGRAVVLVGAAITVAVAVYGITKLAAHHNPLEYFDESSPITIGFHTMDDYVGGTAVAYLVFDVPGEHGARNLDLLKGMEQLEAHLLAYRQPGTGEAVVSNVSSLLDIVRESQRALHEGDEAFYRLPDTQRGVTDSLFVFENAGSEELWRIVTPDYTRTQLAVRLKWMDADAYEPFDAHIQQGVKEYIGDRAEVETTGTIFNVLTVIHSMIGDLASSFSGALVAIAVMMMLLLRRPKLGLIALGPNLFPIAVLLGFMGLARIPIDLNNLLIASIVLGIAVDDTIHYMHQFRVAYGVSGDVEAAIRHAVDHAGRAMVGTTAVLVLGFGVYLASRLVSLQRFGLLVALACVVALVADLLLSPALLRVFYARTAPKEGVSHAEPHD